MFSNIIGHDRVKQQLERDISSGQLHQSYLFAGPEHVGKMRLINAFLSQYKAPRLKIFPDNGESLKVEEVRDIVEFASRRTAEGEWTFCVIEHVERMTPAAMNAFLKVLEEPSSRFVFLMTTRAEHLLLPTILSRLQVYRCGLVPTALVKQRLERECADPLLIDEVMKLSRGRIGLAMTLLRDSERLERLRELYDHALMVLENDLVDGFSLADHLTKKELLEADLELFLAYFALKLQRENPDRYEPVLSRLQELKQLFSSTQVNKRLFLENMMLMVHLP